VAKAVTVQPADENQELQRFQNFKESLAILTEMLKPSPGKKGAFPDASSQSSKLPAKVFSSINRPETRDRKPKEAAKSER